MLRRLGGSAGDSDASEHGVEGGFGAYVVRDLFAADGDGVEAGNESG